MLSYAVRHYAPFGIMHRTGVANLLLTLHLCRTSGRITIRLQLTGTASDWPSQSSNQSFSMDSSERKSFLKVLAVIFVGAFFNFLPIILGYSMKDKVTKQYPEYLGQLQSLQVHDSLFVIASNA